VGSGVCGAWIILGGFAAQAGVVSLTTVSILSARDVPTAQTPLFGRGHPDEWSLTDGTDHHRILTVKGSRLAPLSMLGISVKMRAP
jgi:hypothetical protein